MGEFEGEAMTTDYDAFIDRLIQRNYQGLELKHEYLPGKNHDDSSSTGYPNGLEFVRE
jgi:hypothetical protein